MPLEPGLTYEMTLTVAKEHLARLTGGDIHVPVLATPVMIAMLEETAHKALVPYLAPGQSSVGTLVSVKHLAATPLGMQVRLRAEVLVVEGRRVNFRVEAWDEVEKIGAGEHERFIIDLDKFIARVERKAAGALTPK